MSAVTVWVDAGNRMWWSCPTCKVEAGITLPAKISEVADRMTKFNQQHKTCADQVKERMPWRQ